MLFKKFQIVTALVIILSSLIVIPAGAQAPAPTTPLSTTRDIVLSTVASVFAPSGDEAAWSGFVCGGMTEGGCGFLKDHQADLLWNSTQNAIGDSVSFDDVAAQLADGSQVWKMTVTVFHQYRQNRQSATQEVYVHVVFDPSKGMWLLNRVLYGPHISL